MKYSLFLAFFLAFFSFTGWGQARMNISGLEFFAGKWKTNHAWGYLEESWSRAEGNNMVGSFRCMKDGVGVFYELILIEQKPDSLPVMYLRHFGPGNIAWEEKNQPAKYILEELSADKAVFVRADKNSRLTYYKPSMLALVVTLETKGREGNWNKDVFEFTRDFN